MTSNAEALSDKFAPPSAEEVVKGTPIIGQEYTTFSDAFGLGKAIGEGDGMAIAEGAQALAGDILGWGSTIADIAADPIGWLIEQGLSFLMDVIYPLKDMLELVTGDPEALSAAAEEFSDLGQQLVDLGDNTQELLSSGLQSWQGPAAEAAGERMAKFCAGVRMIAGDAGNVAQILQLSSMLMQFAYDILMGIISSFIEWLILTWIPALAAAGPTFGGSTAAAGTATGVESAVATSKGSKAVSTGSKYLDEVQELIGKLSKNGASASKLFKEGATEAIKDGATSGLKDATGIPLPDAKGNVDPQGAAEGGVTAFGKGLGVGKGLGYGEQYPEGSDQEIDESLEI